MEIRFVKKAKMSGVYIDYTLSWDAHVNIIAKKIVRVFVVLKISHSKCAAKIRDRL